MAIKYRYVDLLVGTSRAGANDSPAVSVANGQAVAGEARGRIGLGAPYGRIHKFEFKGDDTDADGTTTLAIHDAKGRLILAAKSFDPGADDSTTLMTDQEVVVGTTVSTASTFGVGYMLTAIETEILDIGGDFAADTEGSVAALCAESPLFVAVTGGTDGDWLRVGVWVET